MSSSEEKKTVYVLFRGRYSDREIVAVFSTRETVERFVAVAPRIYDLEEWPLDEIKDPVVTMLFNSKIYKETGNVREIKEGNMVVLSGLANLQKQFNITPTL